MTQEKEDSCDWLKPWRFRPGQSGNPKGRDPQASAAIRKFTKKAVQETFAELMLESVEELGRIRDNLQESGVRAAVASIILRSRAKGEMSALNDILDRIVGKVPQKTHISGGDGEPFQMPVMNFFPTSALEAKPASPIPAQDAPVSTNPPAAESLQPNGGNTPA